MRLFFVVLFATNSVYAADTCCVDEDIAAAFLSHATYSRDWPTSFPIRLDIEELAYIGTSNGYDGRNTSVAWKSEREVQTARELVADAILAANWVVVPDHDVIRVRSGRGFIPHQPVVTRNSQQFCRDRDGVLSIQARQTNIGTVVTLSHYRDRNRPGQDCAGMIAERRIQPSYDGGLISYLPTLALPEMVKMSPYGSGGAGGGSKDAHASTSVETDMSGADIVSHFESQMATQQWIMDTGFLGSTASGQIWLRSVDGLNLVCIVTAMDTGDRLRLRMHIEPL